MFSPRTLLAFLLLVLGYGRAQAGGHRRGGNAGRAEVETAEPSLSEARAEARRHTANLADALRLSHAQAHALATAASVEVRALALALTPADAVQATQQHLQAVAGVLSANQLAEYGQLHQVPEMQSGLVAGL